MPRPPALLVLLVVTGALAAGVVVAESPPARQSLSGQVDTRVKEGTAGATAIVYAEPLGGAAAPRAATFTMTQKNKSFTPRVMGIPVGSTVSFVNDDAIFHNVFSLSPPQPFDLGLYRSGASKERTFTQASTYYVFCNIHPQMIAFVVVAPSPWVTTAADGGTWRLDVPAGRYRVTALSERAAPVTVEMTAGQPAAAALTLDESKFVPTLHLNKFGKPYPASAYREGRDESVVGKR